MKTVDANTFIKARVALDPLGLVSVPVAYESIWMSESSPYKGKLLRLLIEDEQGVMARIAVLLPADGGEANFCFYGRRAELSESKKAEFFNAFHQWLCTNGIVSIQGPIEFSTWHPNRFVCKQGSSPWFPGEQKMPEYAYNDFIQGGFTETAHYSSSLVGDLKLSIDKGLAAGVDRALNTLNIETQTSNNILDILPTLYNLSCVIFAENYAYSPISYKDFKALYQPILALDSVVIVAKIEHRPVAMAFSYNIGAYNDGKNTVSPKLTAVLKTIGVHPSVRQQHIGLGISYLTHKLWFERGFQSIIHAYMKTDNASSTMSASFAEPIREYALVRWGTEQ
jgi:hypothetical protein